MIKYRIILRIKYTILICVFALSVVFCQQKDTSLYDWVPEAVIGLNINQIALSK